MLEEGARQFVTEWSANFLDPQKRLFWGYLLSALLLALLWLVFVQRQNLRSAFATLFARDVWASASARADYLVFTLNTLIMGGLASRLLGKTVVAYFLFELLHDLFDGRAYLLPDAPAWLIASGFTVFLFVADDFARYIVHRLMHGVPFLWAFHKVHHSATHLNPMTVLRTHPVEGVLFALRGAVVQGVCIALFVYCFGDRVSLLMVLGANVFKFAFNALGSNLRHSEIPIGYWPWLEKLFLSPAQHQIHHSVDKAHHDKNFGVVLAIWDVLFKSHCHSTRDQKLRYGLADNAADRNTLKALYWSPFAEAFRLLLPRPREAMKLFRKQRLAQSLD